MSRPIGLLALVAVVVMATACSSPAHRATSPTPTATTVPCPGSGSGTVCTATAAPIPEATPGPIAYVQPSAVSFIDDELGWVVGNACDSNSTCRPAIAQTNDGGADWKLLPAPPTRVQAAGEPEWPSEADLDFISSTVGWVFNPFLALTINGGQSWVNVALPTQDPVSDVVQFDSATWVVTDCAPAASCPTTLWRSSSPGGPFHPASAQPPNLGGGNADSGQTQTSAIVSGGRLILYSPVSDLIVSTSSGQSWARFASPCSGFDQQLGGSPGGILIDVCAAEIGGGMAPKESWFSDDGGSHWALRSRNGGMPFTNTTVGSVPSQGYPNDIAMPTGVDAWMSMGRADVYETHDDGVTWSATPIPGQFLGNAGGAEQVVFTDRDHGWALGPEGLWRTTNGHTWMQSNILGPVTGYLPT
jgi:hypothetical protein